MSDVFVSYKRENLAAVGRLVEALRAEGIGVWWDQDIAPNAAWEATIERELAAAKLVIVAWSPASVASENVKAEARGARGQGRLLQVFVEACEPPLFFGERQGVDLEHWAGAASHAAFRSVLEAIRTGLETSSAPTADRVSPTDPAPPPLPAKPSIAILPFADMTGSEGQDYFTDGMVIEITNALARFKSIFVIASSSALTFKGKAVGAQDAARRLGVRYVLEGSVRKAGGRVRIAVQLIDAADGAQIWTDRFEDTLEDVFALQDRVALSVAAMIEPTVQQAEVRRAIARPTENMGSYDLYLRALPPYLTLGRAGLLQAVDLLHRAIALDPGYGLALATAATCHYLIDRYGWSEDQENERRQAIELAHRALAVASDDAGVLARAAFIASDLEHDTPAAIALVERALALNPGSATVWASSAAVHLRAGATDLAIQHIETSMRLEPIGPISSGRSANLGLARFQQRRFAEAAALSKTFAQQTESAGGYFCMASCYGHLGQLDQAREALAQFRSRTPVPFDDFAHSVFHDPAHIKLFLDGIALAEGKTPSGPAGGAKRP